MNQEGARVHGASIVICTIGRTDGALAAARSAASDDPRAEIIIVDQNESLELQRLVAREPVLVNVRVVRMAPCGLAAARNAGVRACRGWIVAFTDDDCEVLPGWLAALSGAFAANQRIGVVFGNVEAPAYDRGAGFIPSYRVREPVLARSLADKARIEGMGACMAVRREAWTAIGGFDESLGSGAPFRAGEDADLVVRALHAGWQVVETPDAAVVHHGFRTWAQGRQLIDGYMYGLGATNVKMLRLAPLTALRPLVTLAWRWLAGAPVVDLNQLPPRLPRLGAFLAGAWDGLRLPLAPGSGHFLLSRHPGLPLPDVTTRRGDPGDHARAG